MREPVRFRAAQTARDGGQRAGEQPDALLYCEGIDGMEGMRLVRDDIAARITVLLERVRQPVNP